MLEEISIEPGDMVSKGDILAVYDIESIDDAVDAKKEELDSTDEATAQMWRSGHGQSTRGRARQTHICP